MTLATTSPPCLALFHRAAAKVSASGTCQGALLGGPPTPLLRSRTSSPRAAERREENLERCRNNLRVKGDKVLLFFISLCFALDDVSDVHN